MDKDSAAGHNLNAFTIILYIKYYILINGNTNFKEHFRKS